MIEQFRKKPVIIDAVHYKGTKESYMEVCDFVGNGLSVLRDRVIMIPTLESPHEIR